MAAGSARAHPGAAPGPIFDAAPCVETVRADEQRVLQIGYGLEEDYVQLTEGDIPLPDALTHQFFAFRGTILVHGFTPELHDLDGAVASGAPLPLWISTGDVDRADRSSQAAGLSHDLGAAREPEAILDASGAFEGRYLRITGDGERAAITLERAARGVGWDVSAIPAGLYTVAAYIFSPPWNGWQVRPGLVKIQRADEDPPAAVVGRVQEAVFLGQGRRVALCVHAPPGTTLRTYARLEGQPPSEWREWGREGPIASGASERCFRSPDRDWVGAVRVRADLIDSTGRARSFYSPDVLTQLSTPQDCKEDEAICCEAEPSDEADCSAAGGACSAGSATQTRSSSGCAVRGPRSTGGASRPLALVWVLALVLLVVRAHRRR